MYDTIILQVEALQAEVKLIKTTTEPDTTSTQKAAASRTNVDGATEKTNNRDEAGVKHAVWLQYLGGPTIETGKLVSA